MVTSPPELRRERRVSTAASIDPLLRRSVAASNTPSTPGENEPPENDRSSVVDAARAWWRNWCRQWRRWRRARRRALLIVVVMMSPVAWSYFRALTGPGSDSLQARTVEWARDNHLGWVVDRTEKWWYANHQAKIGGTPNLAAGPVVAAEPAVGATTATASASAAAPPPRPGHLTPPHQLTSPAGVSVGNEGQWTPLGPTVNGVQGAYVTSIRPDALHTSVLDAVIWIDPTVLKFRQYPGLKIPGSPWDRPPSVEPDRQAQLVAAFDGGFRIQDSHGGMILGHHTLQAMRDGAATFAISDSGVPNIGAWGTDISNSSTLDSARQSLDPIVVNGAPNPALQTDPNRTWGFTGPANKTAVWRSGAGIRADGSLVWVGGDGLTVESLAETLVRAGAIRGMQLDINQDWVQLNTYAANSSGVVHGRKLLSGMQHTGDRWLTEDTRDFIAVFTRTT